MSGTDYTLTPVLGLYKPITNADSDMWGEHWNFNADVIDGLVPLAVGDARWVNLTGDTMTGTLNLANPGVFQMSDAAGTSGFRLVMQGDNNLVMQGTTSTGANRILGAIYMRSDASTWMFNTPMQFSSITTTLGAATFSGGIKFGNVMAGAPNDLSKHISLYDGWGGFNITSDSLNVIAGGSVAATFHSEGMTVSGATKYVQLAAGAKVWLDHDPTSPEEAATKRYVDALLVSPPFTGIPTAPTAQANTNTTQLATTQFANNILTMAQISVAGGVDVTLPLWACGYGMIYLYGALTANINVIFPVTTTAVKTWQIMNVTSGGFTITLKGVSGGTVPLRQGGRQQVWTDTGGIYYANTDTATPAPADNSTGIANTYWSRGTFLALTGGGLTGGLGFGSSTAASNTDLTRHVNLWGGIYGFGVTGGRLNYNASGGVHMFITENIDRASIGPAGITLAGGDVILARDPTAPMHATTKQYVDGKTGGVGGFVPYDARGNVGISVLPPANQAPSSANANGGWTFGWGLTANNWATNGYYDGTSWRYLNADTLWQQQMTGSQIIWQFAPAGVKDAVAVPVTKLAMDGATGNLYAYGHIIGSGNIGADGAIYPAATATGYGFGLFDSGGSRYIRFTSDNWNLRWRNDGYLIYSSAAGTDLFHVSPTGDVWATGGMQCSLGIIYRNFSANWIGLGWDGAAGALNYYIDGAWNATVASRGWAYSVFKDISAYTPNQSVDWGASPTFNNITCTGGTFQIAPGYYLQRNSSNGQWLFVENNTWNFQVNTNGDVQARGFVYGQGLFSAGWVYAGGVWDFYFGIVGGNRHFQIAANWYWQWEVATGQLNWQANGVCLWAMRRNGDNLVWNPTGCVGGNGIYQNISDRRFKRDIKDSGVGLSEVLRLRPISFKRVMNKNDPRPPRTELGFISQEVAEVIPEAVSVIGSPLPDGTGGLDDDEPTQALGAEMITAALVNAVKELHAEIQTLKGQRAWHHS